MSKEGGVKKYFHTPLAMSHERGAEVSQLTLAKYHTLREATDGLSLWVAPTHTVYGYICC